MQPLGLVHASTRCAAARAVPRRQCRVQAKPQQQTAPRPSSPRNVEGAELTKEELASLQILVPHEGAAQAQAVCGLISAGANRAAEQLPELEGAMLVAEQAYLGALELDGWPSVVASPSTTSVWQPIFASAGGWPRLLYIPVPEYFCFEDGTLDIVTLLGPITTHFLGRYEWVAPDQLQYAIDRIHIQLGSVKFGFPLPGPVQLKNMLRFFYSTDAVACARSKLGGTMLLVPRLDQAGVHTLRS